MRNHSYLCGEKDSSDQVLDQATLDIRHQNNVGKQYWTSFSSMFDYLTLNHTHSTFNKYVLKHHYLAIICPCSLLSAPVFSFRKASLALALNLSGLRQKGKCHWISDNNLSPSEKTVVKHTSQPHQHARRLPRLERTPGALSSVCRTCFTSASLTQTWFFRTFVCAHFKWFIPPQISLQPLSRRTLLSRRFGNWLTSSCALQMANGIFFEPHRFKTKKGHTTLKC